MGCVGTALVTGRPLCAVSEVWLTPGLVGCQALPWVEVPATGWWLALCHSLAGCGILRVIPMLVITNCGQSCILLLGSYVAEVFGSSVGLLMGKGQFLTQLAVGSDVCQR